MATGTTAAEAVAPLRVELREAMRETEELDNYTGSTSSEEHQVIRFLLCFLKNLRIVVVCG